LIVTANRPPAALLAAAVLGLALTSYTTAQSADRHLSRACIEPTMAGNWTKYDDHTILVESGATTFRVNTGACPRLSGILPRISAVVRGGGSICGPHDVDLFVSDGGGRAPCFIDSITPMSPDEARAFIKAKH
jgi:hypothetical protein